MIIETTILVIGAGPGGAATALHLSQANIPCMVVDKAIFPRDKVCGDGLTGKVFNVLNRIDPNILIRLKEQPLSQHSWGGRFVGPNLKAISIAVDPAELKVKMGSPGMGMKRINFDNFMVEEMRKRSSIQLMEGVAIDHYELKEDGYLASNKDKSVVIKAKVVVVANGAQSSFSRLVAGFQVEERHYAAGVRAYFEGIANNPPNKLVEFYFLKEYLPGYLWIFPVQEGVFNVGIGLLKQTISQNKLNLKSVLLEVIATHPELKERFKEAKLIGKIDGFGLPMGSKDRQVSGERYLLVGDAAHLIDPLSGEGVGNALYSGWLAAEQLKKSIVTNDFSAKTLNDYNKRVDRTLRKELRFTTLVLRAIQYEWFVNFVLSWASKNKKFTDLLSNMLLNEKEQDKLTNPIFLIRSFFKK